MLKQLDDQWVTDDAGDTVQEKKKSVGSAARLSNSYVFLLSSTLHICWGRRTMDTFLPLMHIFALNRSIENRLNNLMLMVLWSCRLAVNHDVLNLFLVEGFVQLPTLKSDWRMRMRPALTFVAEWNFSPLNQYFSHNISISGKSNLRNNWLKRSSVFYAKIVEDLYGNILLWLEKLYLFLNISSRWKMTQKAVVLSNHQ